MKSLFILIALSLSAFSSDLFTTTVAGTTYNSAIVIEASGELKNLAEYEGFFEDQTSICFNGDIEIAYLIALEIQKDLWIYDEYSLDSVEIKGGAIVFSVFDEFTYNDLGASIDERKDFITTYSAVNCN